MRQAASVMNLNPCVPHMYFEFIMHTMVNYTHTTFPSAQNAMEKALAQGGLVCLPRTLPCTQHNIGRSAIVRFSQLKCFPTFSG